MESRIRVRASLTLAFRAMPFTSSIYRIQLSRGRIQGFEPFSNNWSNYWQEPVIANSFPKGSSDWTRVCSFALSVDRSRASLSLVFEVGQRAGPKLAFFITGFSHTCLRRWESFLFYLACKNILLMHLFPRRTRLLLLRALLLFKLSLFLGKE